MLRRPLDDALRTSEAPQGTRRLGTSNALSPPPTLGRRHQQMAVPVADDLYKGGDGGRGGALPLLVASPGRNGDGPSQGQLIQLA